MIGELKIASVVVGWVVAKRHASQLESVITSGFGHVTVLMAVSR